MNPFKNKYKTIFKYLFFSVLIWIVIHLLVISIDGLTDNTRKSDVAIVFGSKVNNDGNVSKRLKARLDVAIDLYRNKLVDFILVSGGIGIEGFDEAQVMKAYLVENNISEKAILVDNQGNNTYLTAFNFLEINKSYHFESVVLVSQFFHLTRAKLIFRQLGFENTATAHARFFEYRDFYSLLREFPAYYSYLLKY